MNHQVEELIEKFVLSITVSLDLLYRKKLYGQLLILLYSHVDALGLLDAPPTQTKASGDTFKNWVKKYMLTDARINFNEVDFWSARCAVLHTFTSQSDLTDGGKARQLQYYSGPKDSPQAKMFVTTAPLIDCGKHIPAHIEDILLVFLEALKTIPTDLSVRCKTEAACEDRLRNVLQLFRL